VTRAPRDSSAQVEMTEALSAWIDRREVKEIWFAGLCKWWGAMPCDLLSKPIVAE